MKFKAVGNVMQWGALVGKILGEGYVGMVQNAYEVEWEAGEVRVGPHGDGNLTWELPR